MKHQRELMVQLRAPGSACEKPESTDDKPASPWECLRQVWKHLKVQLSSLQKPSSLGMLLVGLEIIATTYHSTIFRTDEFNLYSPLWIHESL